MKLSPTSLLVSAALIAASTVASAQIERLDLSQMIAKTDNSVIGTIVRKEVIRIDHPIDGPELYFTTLTIQGTSLEDGQELSVDVTFPGGFIDEKHGVHNSVAPSADDIRAGNRVVAFYKWVPNMGGEPRRMRCTRRTAVSTAPSKRARKSSCRVAATVTRSRRTYRSRS